MCRARAGHLALVLASFALFVDFSTSRAEAGFTCTWKEGKPECISPAGTEDFPIRLRKTRALFEISGCEVTQIIAWSKGVAEWIGAGYPEAMEVDIEYRCGDAEARPKQASTARYGFICPKRQFTYYESGFSYDSNLKPSHWDSQGTSTPIPPRDVFETNNNTVEPLYRAWCL